MACVSRHLDPAVDSLAGEALQRQAPAVWYDAETDPRISREMLQAWSIKSVLAVPIRVSEKVLGIAILSTSSDYRHFTSDEIELVWGIANSVALAVDNARLYEETRQRLAESQGLQRVAAALLRKVSPEEVLEIVCTEAQQLTGATGSAVLLLEEDTWLRVAYSTGAVPAFFDRIPVEGSLAGIAVRRDEPFLTNDPAGEAYEYLRGKRPTAFLSMPLHANGDVIGVLEVVDKPGGFVKDDVRIVSLFANQAAINIEHARLNQQAGQLAVLEERQRLARELHDSVVQSLYSMTLYADAAALAFVAGKQDVTVNHLQELRDTARSAMHDMRLLIFELHPPALEQEGLVTALRVRLAAVEARAGLQTELDGRRRATAADRDRTGTLSDRSRGAQQCDETRQGAACDDSFAVHRHDRLPASARRRNRLRPAHRQERRWDGAAQFRGAGRQGGRPGHVGKQPWGGNDGDGEHWH